MFITLIRTCTEQSWTESNRAEQNNKKLISLYADLVRIELLCRFLFFLHSSSFRIEVLIKLMLAHRLLPIKLISELLFFLLLASLPFLSLFIHSIDIGHFSRLGALCNFQFILYVWQQPLSCACICPPVRNPHPCCKAPSLMVGVIFVERPYRWLNSKRSIEMV